ncbi:hypothetical protein D3C83_170830 [compost metagenome]
MFALEEALDRVGELRVREPVCRQRFHREEAACELVFALGAALEHLDVLLDAEFQRLVITGLEMEAGQMLRCAPIASI